MLNVFYKSFLERKLKCTCKKNWQIFLKGKPSTIKFGRQYRVRPEYKKQCEMKLKE